MDIPDTFLAKSAHALPAEVHQVYDAFVRKGIPLYLVGGPVRDLLAGNPVKDWDFCTPALPEVIKEIVDPLGAIYEAGAKFGTIGLAIGPHIFEITTFRVEKYAPGSRKPEVQFTTDLEQDLSRRDFTINSRALDLRSGKIIDPFGGEADWKWKVLATPSDPIQTFTDDPLRILRAVRFGARYRFQFSRGIVSAAHACHAGLETVARERKLMELEKIISGSFSDVFAAVRLAQDLDCFTDLFGGTNAGNFGLSLIVGDRTPYIEPSRGLFLALMQHWGADLSAMRLPNDAIAAARKINEAFKYIHSVFTVAHVRQITRLFGPKVIRDAMWMSELVACDLTPEFTGAFLGLCLTGDPVLAPVPIDGHDCLKLGLEGKQVGEALKWAEREMCKSPFLTRERLLRRLEAVFVPN